MKQTLLFLAIFLMYIDVSAETYRASLAGRYIWRNRDIAVCWENPSRDNLRDRKWVESAIKATWQRYSSLEFTGWEACTANSKGIRIGIVDEGPHTRGLGTLLDGRKYGMV